MQELQMFVYFAVRCDGTELSQAGWGLNIMRVAPTAVWCPISYPQGLKMGTAAKNERWIFAFSW